MVALHPDAGIGLLDGKPAEAVEAGKTLRKLELGPWAGVNCDISKESENQEVTLQAYFTAREFAAAHFRSIDGSPDRTAVNAEFPLHARAAGARNGNPAGASWRHWDGHAFPSGSNRATPAGGESQISLGPVGEEMRNCCRRCGRWRWAFSPAGTPMKAPGTDSEFVPSETPEVVAPPPSYSPPADQGKANPAEVPWGDWNDGWSMRLRVAKIHLGFR